MAFGGPWITGPQHIFVRGSDGIEFLAPVGQLHHVDSYNEQLVIVRGGKHVGFVGIYLYLWWHNKSQPRKALVTILDASSITVKIGLCAHVLL